LAVDTYIRTEITFFNKYEKEGTKFYLNPVFRYNGDKPSNALRAVINVPGTWIFRLLTLPSWAALLILIVWFSGKRKIQK